MATTTHSLYLAGGGTVNANYTTAQTIFTTASNQYAVLTTADGNVGQFIMLNSTPIVAGPNGGVSYYVPPSTTVSGGPGGSQPYSLIYVVFQTT